MALSYQDFTSDGETLIYPVAFPYLNRKHVAAITLQEPLQILSLTFLSANSVRLSLALPVGAKFRIYRNTPKDKSNVVYQNGLLTPDALNLNRLQDLYCIQELYDQLNASASGGLGVGLILTPSGGNLIDLQDLLAILQGQIAENQLTQFLQDRISLVDGPAGLVEKVAKEIADRTFAVAEEASARAQAIASEAALRSQAILNEAAARVLGDQNEATTRAAAVLSEQTARIDGDAAIASDVTTLFTRMGAADAAIVSEQTARSDGDAALTTSVNALTTRMGGAEAAILTEQTARSDGDSALTTSLNALTSRVSTAESAIVTEQNTRASGDSANAASITALTARVDKTRRWSNDVLVNGNDASLLKATLTMADGATALQNGDQLTGNESKGSVTYRVTGRVVTTGTPTGAVSIFTSSWNGSTWGWSQRIVSEAGTTSNHVKFYLASGVPSVRLYSHTSTYTVRYDVDQELAGYSAEAAIINEQDARVSADAAITTDVTSLLSRMNSAESAIVTEQSTRATADTAESDARTTLAAAIRNEVFTPLQTWEFRNTADGWVGTSVSLTTGADALTVTATGADPTFQRSGLSITGAQNTVVRARIKRTGGSAWQGTLYYATAGHGISESYKKTVGDPGGGATWQIVEWDMELLSAGGTDWTSNTITALRFDWGSSSSDAFQVDWISVGKRGFDPVVQQGVFAAISSESTTRASADSAMASDITTLSTTVGDHTASIQVHADSIDGIQAKYAVKVDVNGRVGGFGLIGEPNAMGGTTTSFIVLADRFAIVNPANNNAVKVPFIVQNGQVWIDSAALINANAIVANMIQAGSITASKITVTGAGAALNTDPLTSDGAAWVSVSNSAWEVATVTDGKVGNSVLRSTTAQAGPRAFDRNFQAVDPNKTYRLHAWVRRKSGSAGVYLAMQFLDASGNTLTTGATGWAGTGSYYYWGLSNANTTTLPADSVWREYEFTMGPAQIPDAARTMRLGALFGESTTGVVEVQDFRIEEMIGTSLVVSGGITADKISVAQLSALAADLGTVTAGTLATDTGTDMRAEISSIGSFPVWFGSGTKTAGNGKFYVDTAGNVVANNGYFRGDIQATSINGVAVGTGNISSNAVTLAASVTTAAATGWFISTTTIQTLTMACSGAPVSFNVGATVAAGNTGTSSTFTVTFELWDDTAGVQIANWQNVWGAGYDGGNDLRSHFASPAAYTPAAGTRTFSLRARCNPSITNAVQMHAANRTIQVIETKR